MNHFFPVWQAYFIREIGSVESTIRKVGVFYIAQMKLEVYPNETYLKVGPIENNVF